MRIGDIYPGFRTTQADTAPTGQSPGQAAEAQKAAQGKKSGNGMFVKIAIIGLAGILFAAKFLEKRGA